MGRSSCFEDIELVFEENYSGGLMAHEEADITAVLLAGEVEGLN